MNLKTKAAVVLLSGGQDSTTCLYWALGCFERVEAVGFNYGQSHARELEQAQKIADQVGVQFRVVDIRGLLAKSSLTDGANHNDPSYVDPTLPASFTAGRNILFLAIAASYGAERGINDIVAGVCQTDFSGYPDCRRTTIDAMQNTLSLGLGNGDYRIHTPLMYLDKAETWRMAKELGCLEVIISDTVTDYNASNTVNEWGMGEYDNPASKLRADGYFKAKANGWL